MNKAITKTIAFDVYGTLIDTHGLIEMLEHHVGVNAFVFSQLWRQKQLEYSFRRGLMKKYRDFSVCTAQALEYTSLSFGVSLTQMETQTLLDAYQVLPIFEDVAEGLELVKNAGFRLYAFSNGKATDIAQLLKESNISRFFIDIISVDEVQSFKPDPIVYQHFLRKSNASGSNAWMVSSNPFDVIGAVSAGMQSVWVQRSPKLLMDPWEIAPTVTINGFGDLVHAISNYPKKSPC
ncbi:MAG: haloacid dehalogenase type II [Chlorobium sp.]|jgi:2-haloacid dehalogenase|nr:MAG: haloacid dehalogenase type II [Chlorobium sp.]